MISVVAVLGFLATYWLLPPDVHRRAMRFAGRQVLAPDEMLVAWWQRRGARTPGQARTTQLLQMLVSELNAGILTTQAFTHVLGTEYTSPDSLLAAPPTVDIRVWSDVSRVWTASDAAGFSLAGALKRIHSYALVDQEITREVLAAVSAPKFGLISIAMMPGVTWMLAGSLGADPIHFLLRSFFGWACILTGLSCYLAAWFAIRAMSRRAMA